MSFASTPGVLPQVKAGKLRALAVTSAARLAQLPDVPTLAESGLTGYEASVWYGVVAPARTPEPIVARLNIELTHILQDPKVRRQMAQNDFDPAGSTPAQFTGFIRAESQKRGQMVRSSGAKVG